MDQNFKYEVVDRLFSDFRRLNDSLISDAVNLFPTVFTYIYFRELKKQFHSLHLTHCPKYIITRKRKNHNDKTMDHVTKANSSCQKRIVVGLNE